MIHDFSCFLRYCSYMFMFSLTLFCATLNSAYAQNDEWNIIKDDEDWDVFAYKPSTVRRHIALSLGRLQKDLMRDEIKPETLLPITKITGIIFDDSGELILLGIEEAGDGVVNIVPDDIVLAMRSMLISDQPPGVSIDPVFNDGSSDNMTPFQNVVYFGGIKDTRAGLFSFNSDYYMKRLAAGEISAPIKNFSRYADLVIEQQNTSSNKSNRFWFYPEESQFIISSDYNIMLLHKSGIEILTEEQHLLFEKKLLKNLYSSKKTDPMAKEFADQFTRRYGELSSVYPDLAKLKNFFALCEIFKWAENRAIRLGLWKYLLYEYHPVHIHTPSKANTVKVMLLAGGSRALFLVGGVQAEIRLPAKPIIDNSEQVMDLRKAVYLSRPSSSAVYWEYPKEKSYASSPVEKLIPLLKHLQINSHIIPMN